MPHRHLPVRPNLKQLKHQAKDLLEAIHAGEPSALDDLRAYHPERVAPEDARLADAQLVLARSYEASSWPRLVQACELVDAIWCDQPEKVREMLVRHPALLHETANIRRSSSWGPPSGGRE